MINNNAKKESLISLVDSFFVINKEMIEKNGEDSYASSINDECGLMCVFDGCGGIGSRKYAAYGNKTGAYLASHTVAKSALDWFYEFNKSGVELSGNSIKKISQDITEKFTRELKALESGAETSMIKGDLTKSFPTTASMILFRQEKNRIYSAFVWAGDSRGFIMSPKGISQVTIDDIGEEEDAYTNLTSDSRLTNVIAADGKYHLNSRIMSCPAETVFITATDGCFGYFSTPMEFEFALLDSLVRAQNVQEWKQNLYQSFLRVAGDDYTLGAVVCGFKTFKNLKKAYTDRRNYLYRTYIAGIEHATAEDKARMWETYKKDYYRGVK
ncbi:MAG: protein phosphatase 2C domain-containing protein [Clostridia bacterium]|nr:protein phosphatase 2C domain-containing protein [Clostridia bacterium]